MSYSVLIGLGFLAVVASLIAVGVRLLTHKNETEVSFRFFLLIYFYVVAAVSLMTMVLGASLVTKAALSDVFGRSFSYYTYETMAVDSMIGPEGEKMSQQAIEESKRMEQERVEDQYRSDLINGISALVVGLIFLLIHVWGWRSLDPAAGRADSWLYKGYVLMQLGVFSVVTLVSLAMGISGLLRYLLEAEAQYGGEAPGEALALAIWSTPVWLAFIWVTLRMMKAETIRGKE